MNTKETAGILQLLKAAYPRFYSNSSERELALAIKVWQAMFPTESYEDVCFAVKCYMSHDNGFPPTAGQIRSELTKAKTSEFLPASEAWVLVDKAVSNGTYGAAEEFAKLPPIIQKVVGSPAMLRDWALLDNKSYGVIHSTFLNMYKAEVKEQTENLALPAGLLEQRIAMSQKNLIDTVKQIGESIETDI